ncbi:phthiocerol/phenolphthiocerol synthesis polyketide synthase type I PpsE [Mycolicibacterium litorale]|uniref:Phthiocerol/phenolphthiocerol synthesis polyketide synthase type I PpsE n=1 Tax=Mycolicibacterium litorale TaxID=758802 RepID=A0A6S6P480_9MYCO|nr:type I polyketide synthase [Mycolicibacterium litorale]BCI53464.1 phthiocerol/phenolphthiocerol synthesis polyketide synthase type I PpsE [Mycolicibacterium litorale]
MNLASDLDALPPNAIAVVGMAARLPGADSLSAFWDNLMRGEESIVTLPEERLAAAGIGEKALGSASYVRRAALLDGFDEFDPGFFGFPPQTARVMDPQQRVFLQCAWHALEDAGCDPADFDGSIGVFGTSGASIYMLHNLLSHHDPDQIMGQGASFDLINMSLWNDKDYLATRISHQFNLRGPSITVQSACSSSLVAVHMACQSLLSGESDVALAGGVSIRVPHYAGYWHEPGSMVSADGHCRPFDVRADGTVFSSGCGIVVLKPLQAAIEEGDRIHAVIRGSAINNDGSLKMTYAAPNGDAQADVIAEAHAVADVDSSTISYVETHGTATPLGDPIEVAGLRRAFSVSGTSRPGPCALGSVKSNIGHLGEASGIAGLIKTILSVQNRALAPTLHFTSPNPALNLDDGPFFVQSSPTTWEWDGPLRAGVSSFGVGGTNVHLVVEEPPGSPARAAHTGPQVLRLSARTENGLTDFRSALAKELSRENAPDLSDVAFTLGGRRKHDLRMAVVVHDADDACAVLRTPEHDNVFVGTAVEGAQSAANRVVLLFPGQGAQHAGMAQGLYETEAVFAEHFQKCSEGFLAELGFDLRETLFGGAATDLERTDRTQPALFAVEFALGKLLESYGVRAAAYAGHSIGEYAAAALAGVFDLETAIRAVAVRARLMHAAPPGAMIAVAIGEQAVADHLSPDLDLAVLNDPENCVIAGSQPDILKLQNELRRKGIMARRVRTSHAFHSALMDPVVPQFAEFMSSVALRKPHTRLLSNVTGTWMTDDEATDPGTWAKQIRRTVRFSDEIDRILDNPHSVVVEVGPGGTLTGSAIRHPKWSSGHRAVRLMRHQVQNRNDQDTFLLGLGQLWAAGVEVDWSRSSGEQPRRVSLPGYPFARERHWIEPRKTEWVEGRAVTGADAATPATRADGQAGTGKNAQADIERTLQRIWCDCLGVSSVGRTDDFFEIGGDSLFAVGVAMSATSQGLDLTPQDLYENRSVSTLAATLVARYSAGGLTGAPVDDDMDLPVPPTVLCCLEGGLRDPGQRRVPLILRLSADVSAADVAAVVTAVINHHDALRTLFTNRSGSWGQRISPAVEAVDLPVHSLDETLSPGTAQERETVLDLLAEDIGRCDLSSPALSATLVVDGQGVSRYLALSVLELVADAPSREILLTDLFTAFAQRLAGQDIVLPTATGTWREWSQRCVALASHPAVLETRDYWIDNATRTTMHLADAEVVDPPGVSDLARLPLTLTADQTTEIDHARMRYQYTVEEILLGALSRTVAHTLGEGVVSIDVAGDGRSVLKPDVDPRRTVGGFSTVYPVPLACANPETVGAVENLQNVHATLTGVPHHGIGLGLLRYLYAPTARVLSAVPLPGIYLCDEGIIPDAPVGYAPVQFDLDAAMSVRDKTPGLGHAIEIRTYRSAGVLHCDWWYDRRRLERGVVEAMVEYFPRSLSELVTEATSYEQVDSDGGGATLELSLVDLSAE